jgi:hypothetical protein
MDDDLDQYLTNLIPVSEWVWWMWRVTWRDAQGRTKVLMCVSTDTHIESEVQDRWPSDAWIEATWEPIRTVSAPRTLWCPALRRTYPESAWTAGDREATGLG